MKKLKLDELKVQSFVTDLGDDKQNTIKGGLETDNYYDCADYPAFIEAADEQFMIATFTFIVGVTNG